MNPHDQRIELALEILNSESFESLMTNPCHRDIHIYNLSEKWRRYQDLGGGHANLGGANAVRR